MTKNPIFLITLLLANGFRDFILVIIDIVLNIYLAIKLRQFFKKKKIITDKSLKKEERKVTKKMKLSMSEVKNTITTFVLSSFSIIQHLVTFMVLFNLFLIMWYYILTNILTGIYHDINFNWQIIHLDINYNIWIINTNKPFT